MWRRGSKEGRCECSCRKGSGLGRSARGVRSHLTASECHDRHCAVVRALLAEGCISYLLGGYSTQFICVFTRFPWLCDGARYVDGCAEYTTTNDMRETRPSGRRLGRRRRLCYIRPGSESRLIRHSPVGIPPPSPRNLELNPNPTTNYPSPTAPPMQAVKGSEGVKHVARRRKMLWVEEGRGE